MNPVVREGVGILLLFGASLVTVDARSYLSTGAAIPIAAGLVLGAIMRDIVDRDRVSMGTKAATVLALFVGGIFGSWVFASFLFGSTAESARISGFALAVLIGSLTRRLLSADSPPSGER